MFCRGMATTALTTAHFCGLALSDEAYTSFKANDTVDDGRVMDAVAEQDLLGHCIGGWSYRWPVPWQRPSPDAFGLMGGP